MAKKPDKPSQAYHNALLDAKIRHGGNVCTGTFLRPHAPYIKELIARLGIKTVLDYGCGKGVQYDWILPQHRNEMRRWEGCGGKTLEQWWGVEVTKYDPAYLPFAKEPTGKFDLVLCTHTLGMIPITDHGWVIDRLYGFATKALYIAERLERSKKMVGDPALRGSMIGWTMKDWQADVQRPGSTIDVILACRNRNARDEKIQLVRKWDGTVWSKSRQMVSRGDGYADGGAHDRD